MNGHTYTLFYVISFTVLSTTASDVFIINAKSSERSPLSVSLDRSLQTVQELLGDNADEKTLRDQLVSSSSQKPSKDRRERYVLRPVSPHDLTRNNVADLLKLINANKNVKVAKVINKPPQDVQYRLFRNMYSGSVPRKRNGYKYKKVKRPFNTDSREALQPFIKYLLSHTKAPNLKHKFQDLTRLNSANITEDYIDIEELSRKKPVNRYSRDYIDLDHLRFRRNQYPVKAALRTAYSVEANDDSSEATKSKRFEIVKNKQNKKDIKSSESEEVKKKKKATFKHKGNKKKKMSSEDAGTSLSSDKDVSEERVKPKPKKKRYQPAKKKRHHSRHQSAKKDSRESVEEEHYQPAKKKVKFEAEENDEWHDADEPIGLYLQGNKLTMYPPVDPDSSDENKSDDTRRRGDGGVRLPYFLPKRYHWDMDDIHSLGYFFFNGPKGVSLEA